MHNAHAILLGTDTERATAGYFQLSWSGESDNYQLQESRSADFQKFTIVYEGHDLARVMSGKPDGDYYYRVIDPDDHSHTSEVIQVSVAHHPLENAFYFFIAGAIVFIATLVLIIRGNRQSTS